VPGQFLAGDGFDEGADKDFGGVRGDGIAAPTPFLRR